MKLVFISDTHRNNVPSLPEGDVLVHCGDWSSRGTETELDEYCRYLELWKPKFKSIVTIAGNHDWIAEKNPSLVLEKITNAGAIYLNDSGCDIDRYKFWGSPVTPVFFNWAFNRERGERIDAHWQMIPPDTNILVTHGPPYGILDLVELRHSPNFMESVGCRDLLKRTSKLKELKCHAFGHIHTGYGIEAIGKKTFINCSLLDDNYRQVNRPIEMEF